MSSTDQNNEDRPDYADDKDLNIVGVTQGFEFDTLTDIPDGTVLYLSDFIPDALGDVLVASLHDSPIHIISSSPPVSSGELALPGVDSKMMNYVQFDDIRLLSETEFSILIYDHG